MSTTEQQLNSLFAELQTTIREHDIERLSTLNLIASENVMSPAARQALSSDLSNRYSIGSPGNRLYGGCQYFDRIETEAKKLAAELFSAAYVNVQPVSGMVANLIAFSSLLQPGDLILTLPSAHGGHYSHGRDGMLSLFGAKVECLPFDEERFTVDVDRAKAVIREKRPKVVLLGAAGILFQPPVKELRDVCTEVGAKIMYDAAHVVGLIAGGSFGNPLKEGADILTSSTNKTLGGPDHGLVACQDPSSFQQKIEHGVMPLFTSNHHPHHIAALAITLLEWKAFGSAYASQIIRNAQALGRALTRLGIPVVAEAYGFTQSHMILAEIGAFGDPLAITSRLNGAGIVVSPPAVPDDIPGSIPRQLIRLGTSELTRYGMKEEQMDIVAGFIHSALSATRPTEEIQKGIRELRAAFPTVGYCFT